MSSFVLLPVLCGFFVGICVNYLADVMPQKRRLTLPVCLGCGEARTIKELILGKPCKACGKNNGTRFWLVVFFMVVLSTIIWFKPVSLLPYWASEILLLVFSVIFITDLEFRVILEQMSFVGYILAILAGWFLHGWLKTILGGACGFILFLGLYYLGKAFSRRLSRNREEPVDEEALGYGDVHLAGIIGFISGFPFILPALLVAIVLGGIVSAFYILIGVIRKQYMAFQAIPYGPFIILGGVFALYYYL